MKINYFKTKKVGFKGGFTLIELLVVIAIIGILTAIVTANFAQSKAKARDAKRVSDLAQIQLTLELAFDKCNVYPPDINSVDTAIYTGNCRDSLSNDYQLSYFISKIPTETNGSSYAYNLLSSSADYILGAQLETNNTAVLKDSANGTIILNSVQYPCNNNINNNNFYCVVPK